MALPDFPVFFQGGVGLVEKDAVDVSDSEKGPGNGLPVLDWSALS